ncbi:MAG: hypothetical protein WC593_13565 [Methanoregula sp.]
MSEVSLKKKGKVPIQPLPSIFYNCPAPICASLAPIGGGGACDSPVLPKIPIQVMQHYRNRGAIAAGRSPLSVSLSAPKRISFFDLNFRHVFFTFFHSVNPSWIQGLE